MPSFLSTQRLDLRRFTDHDADLLIDLDSDPAVMLYVTGGITTSAEKIRTETLPHFVSSGGGNQGLGYFAAFERSSAEFIGWFEFRPEASAPTQVELGYRLRRPAWGRGLASEGAKALVDKGFADHGVTRVTAYSVVVHTASRRVMEKAGLRYVRTIHDSSWPWKIPGDEAGDVEYALTRDEWLADRAAQST